MLIHQCMQQSQKTLNWVKDKIDSQGKLIAYPDDLVCYYKLPYFLALTGEGLKANHLLNYMHATFFKQEQQITFEHRKTSNPLMAHFWSYVLGWVALGSHKLARYDISYPAADYLGQFQSQDHGGSSPTHPWGKKESIMDVITTAQWGRFALLFGKRREAIQAGEFLTWVSENQPKRDAFYLLVNNNKQLVQSFTPDTEWVSVVYNDKPNQAYFMLGLPCSFLVELYTATQNERYLQAAKRYADFALSCDDSIKNFSFSHKVAWATALLYKQTQEQKYITLCKSITNNLLQMQNQEGIWLSDQDAITSLDQSIEIAIWLHEIASAL